MPKDQYPDKILTDRELTELLAEATDTTPGEIEQKAEELEIEPPEEAEWEPLDEDWEDSPAYQDY